MIRSINLVPPSRIAARRRIIRRNRWVAAVVACAACLAVLGIVRYSLEITVESHGQRMANMHARQADLDRQLALLMRTRTTLLDRARTLAALRRPQPLADQLVALAADAPDGIWLTELRAGSFVTAVTDTAGTAAARTKSPPVAGGASKLPLASQPAPAEPERAIQISGFARDHTHLTQMIDHVRSVPCWSRVELLRAARDSMGTGEALAFRLECHEKEVAR